MKHYSRMPQYQNSIFKIPTAVSGWDEQLLSAEQVDKFIWDNNLIMNKKNEEAIELIDSDNENCNTQESENSNNSDE